MPDTSAYHALRSGGWEHYGWGADRHLTANVFDGIAFNTEATGQWDPKHRPSLPRIPRPSTDSTSPEEPKKRLSVRELWGAVKKQQAR